MLQLSAIVLNVNAKHNMCEVLVTCLFEHGKRRRTWASAASVAGPRQSRKQAEVCASEGCSSFVWTAPNTSGGVGGWSTPKPIVMW